MLDQAIAHRLPSASAQLDASCGGAIIVIDCRSGGILASASWPRYNPGVFAEGDTAQIQQLLSNPARPLFDRAIQMALPPGSVFKIVSACALLDHGVDPRSPVDCEGYLHQPDALRCAIFKQYGIGHGPVTLADALARSCNVYFFHHAEQLGSQPLLDWAQRLGLGAQTKVDLPSETAGSLPKLQSAGADDSHDQSADHPQLDPRPLAIGQGALAATPLQMLRVVAAIANGGFLVTPHTAETTIDVSRATPLGGQANKIPVDFPAPRPIPGLTPEMISAIRKGLRQTVADQQGTAHATVELASVAIAGKTGTAQTGGGQPDNSWFVGYAPADDPQIAFVITLEHAGDAATAAGPVAKLLIEHMNQLGYFPHELAHR